MITFNETKKIFKLAFQQILKKNNSLIIDEAALPAYAHKNILIDYLFWKRIEIAYDFAKKNNYKTVLDFGCGSGVLSYLLSNNRFEVTACDLEFEPLNNIRDAISFPYGIDFIEGDILKTDLQFNKSFDLIIALDVLEHVKNIEDYIDFFMKILKPGGAILVSGPTENILYKFGRKFAGKRFTGDYHVTNISKIRNRFSKKMNVKIVSRLVFPVILFEIFAAKK